MSMRCIVLAALLAMSACKESARSTYPATFEGADYHSLVYVKEAVRLQELGRDAASLELKKMARTAGQDHLAFVLCRMLFIRRGDAEFRRPRLGGASFLGATDYPDWPLEPIEIVDGIPFLVVTGYMLGGLPELAIDYVDYCLKSCDWNPARYEKPTRSQKREALAWVIASPKWKSPLSPGEREYLSVQLD